MRKVYRKLVRDRIPEIIRSHGDVPTFRTMRAIEYKKELLNKLLEETKEAVNSSGDKKEFIKELGDVQEVLTSVYDAFGIECGDVTKIARKRRKERGAFRKKIFLESVE